MKNCTLTRASLRHAKLTGTDLSTALTEKSAGRNVAELQMPIADILESHSRWAESDGREGTPADLTNMDLRALKSLTNRALTALIAPRAILYGLNLEGASLQGSNLAGTDLRGAKLSGADLRGVNLTGAKLNNADLRDVRMGRF